jgi:hypothetical protein
MIQIRLNRASRLTPQVNLGILIFLLDTDKRYEAI